MPYNFKFLMYCYSSSELNYVKELTIQNPIDVHLIVVNVTYLSVIMKEFVYYALCSSVVVSTE